MMYEKKQDASLWQGENVLDPKNYKDISQLLILCFGTETQAQ
jgi:hypothetical protein